MRTKNSMRNVAVGMSSYLLMMLVSLLVRKLLYGAIGEELQGVNGVFLNIISMLGLTELGFGTAIIFNLYRTLAQSNREQTVALLQFYSKIYKIIAAIMMGLGVCLLPFLKYILGLDDLSHLQSSTGGVSVSGEPLLMLIFVLMLLDVAASYLLAYKRAILVADQKGFSAQLATTAVTLLLSGAQIVGLLLTGDYLLFLLLRVVFRVLENVVVAYMANRLYPYIRTHEKVKIDPVIRANIVSNVQAVALHFVGLYVINSTASLLIARMIGVAVAGFYSFYTLLLTPLRTFLLQLTQGVTPSLGNMLAKESGDHSRTVFERVLFITFVLMNFAGVSLLVLLNPFIGTWFGPETVLDSWTVLVLVADFYLVGMAEVLGSLRASAGLFRPDRWVHIALAGLNIGLSVLLAHVIGLPGIFLSTLICHIVKEVLVLPHIVYRNLFEMSPRSYYRRFLPYIGATVLFAAVAVLLAEVCAVGGTWTRLLVRLAICLVVPNGLMVAFFHRTAEFRYCLTLGRGFLGRVTRRLRRGS